MPSMCDEHSLVFIYLGIPHHYYHRLPRCCRHCPPYCFSSGEVAVVLGPDDLLEYDASG